MKKHLILLLLLALLACSLFCCTERGENEQKTPDIEDKSETLPPENEVEQQDPDSPDTTGEQTGETEEQPGEPTQSIDFESGQVTGETDEEPQHYHTLTNTVDAGFLKSEASCASPAIYFQSCACGYYNPQKVFESGEPTGNHVYDQMDDSEEHLLPGAEEIYFYSCICGKNGTKTFSTGDCEHDFSKKIISEKYLKSEATCTQKAVYYYACENCGTASRSETFEDGEWMAHTFDQKVMSDDYKVPGTDGTYYYSCSICGVAGSETFTPVKIAVDTDHRFGPLK